MFARDMYCAEFNLKQMLIPQEWWHQQDKTALVLGVCQELVLRSCPCDGLYCPLRSCVAAVSDCPEM